MPHTLVVTNVPIPVHLIKLGTLTTNIDQPYIESHLPFEPQADEDFCEAYQTSYHGLVKRYRNSTLKPHLTQLLGLEFVSRADDDLLLEATSGHLYQLLQPSEWFGRLRSNDATRKWMMDAHKSHQKVYFVTGLRTFVDARVTRNNKEHSKKDFKTDVPVDTIVAAATTGLPLSFGLDVGVKAGKKGGMKREETYETSNEHVYAIQYRKVAFKWFSKDEADSLCLDPKTYWHETTGFRGAEEREGTTDDIMQATTTEALQLPIEEEVVDDDGKDRFLIISI